MHSCRPAGDAVGFHGHKIAESQPQLGQQGGKIRVLQPAQQGVDPHLKFFVHQKQIPGGGKQPLQKGRRPQHHGPGALEIPPHCPVHGGLPARVGSVQQTQHRPVHRRMDGIVPHQLLKSCQQRPALGGKGFPPGDLIQQPAGPLHLGRGAVVRLVHGRQQLQYPGKAAAQQVGTIPAVFLAVLAPPFLQGIERSAGLAQRGKITVCQKQVLHLACQGAGGIGKAHEKALHQQIGSLGRPGCLGHPLAQQRPAGFRQGSAGGALFDEGRFHPHAPAVFPDFPDQAAVPPAAQIGTFPALGKAAVQKNRLVEKPADLPVPGRRKDGKGDLLPPRICPLEPQGFAPGFKVLHQRRPGRALAQLPHRLAGGELPQNLHRLGAGQIGLPLYKAAQHRVPQLAQAGARLFPQLGQHPRLLPGTGFIVGRNGVAIFAQLSARPHQIFQRHLLPGLVGIFLVQCCPDIGIIARGRHAAGVAGEGVGGGQGVPPGVDRLGIFGRRGRRIVGTGMQQALDMKTARHHQHPAVLGRRFPYPAGHVGFPGQTAVLLQQLFGSAAPGQLAVEVQLCHKGFGGQIRARRFKILFPEFLKVPQTGLFAEGLLKGIGCEIVVGGVIGLLLRNPQPFGLLGGQQNLGIGQIDKPAADAPGRRSPQGHQLRRLVQKGIVAAESRRFPFFLGQTPLLVPPSIVEGDGRPGVGAGKHRQQAVGIFRALHQNAIGLVSPDGLLQMPGAGRAVVADGVIHHRLGQIKGNHPSCLRAS